MDKPSGYGPDIEGSNPSGEAIERKGDSMKIIKWVAYTDDIDKLYPEAAFDDEHYNAVIDALMAMDKPIYGDMHQSYNYNGIPVFEDGYYMVSMRTWGGIMADAMNKKLGKQRYKYIDFYLEGGIYV